MNGWLKLHRSLLEWEWYSCPNTCRLFIHCLIRANHKDSNYRGTAVERGSFLTSLEKLSNESCLSLQSTRTALNNLISTGEINKKSTRKGTKITLCNYVSYQNLDDEANTQSTHGLTVNQHTANTQLTTSKKEKKEKKEKKKEVSRFTPPTLQQVSAYCESRQNRVDPQRFIDYNGSKGWVVGSSKMKCWKSAVRTWEGKDRETSAKGTFRENGGEAIEYTDNSADYKVLDSDELF